MKTERNITDELRKDLATLRMDHDNIESLTVTQAKKNHHPYHKADHNNLEVAKFSAALKYYNHKVKKPLSQ